METAEITFRPFDESDWDMFSGCNSETPEICYVGGDDDPNGLILIIDDGLFPEQVTLEAEVIVDYSPEVVYQRVFGSRDEVKEFVELINWDLKKDENYSFFKTYLGFTQVL